MVIGGFVAGIIGDRYGRRWSFQINLLIFGLGSLLGAFAPNMQWLLGARFLMGLGIGAEGVVAYVAMSELVPPDTRGRWGMALCGLANTSLFISSIISRLVIPSYGWRPMFVIVAVGAIVVWVLRKSMPESPRWLESRGRAKEADEVLRAIETEVEGSTGRLTPPLSSAIAPTNPENTIWNLFSPSVISATIVTCVMMIVMNTTLYGFLAFLPSLLVKSGVDIVKSLSYLTIISLGGPCGALIGILLVDKIGRRPLLILSTILTIVLGVIFTWARDDFFIEISGFLLVTSIFMATTMAWGTYMPELFPTDLRTRGCGFANTVGRIVTIFMPYLVTALFRWNGMEAVIELIVALLLIELLIVWFLGAETKNVSLDSLAPQAPGQPRNMEIGSPL
jgi:putative MFS transporter